IHPTAQSIKSFAVKILTLRAIRNDIASASGTDWFFQLPINHLEVPQRRVNERRRRIETAHFVVTGRNIMKRALTSGTGGGMNNHFLISTEAITHEINQQQAGQDQN